MGHLMHLAHLVLQLHCQHIGQHGGKTLAPQTRFGLLGVGYNHPQHTVLRGISHAQRQDVDVLLLQHFCYLLQPSFAVFNEYRQLLYKHIHTCLS